MLRCFLVIRPTVVIIEFCALADAGQTQDDQCDECASDLMSESDSLEMFRAYADAAMVVSLFLPFSDPDMENVPQMLPCQN